MDLRAEIVSEYRFLYGHVPTAAQLDEILQLEANRESAGNARFGAD